MMRRYILLVMLMVSAAAMAIELTGGKRVVDDTLDVSEQDVRRLEIVFNYPFHYQLTSSQDDRKIFLIRLQPLRPVMESVEREHVHIPWSLTDIISNVELESAYNSYLLVVETAVSTDLSVAQGKNNQTIVITLTPSSPETPDKNRKNGQE